MERNAKICSMCGKEGSEFRCTCKQVYYCGAACQKAGWKGHKPECGSHLAEQIRKNQARGQDASDDLDVAVDQYRLGGIHRKHGRLAEAKKSLKQARRAFTLLQGKDHINVANASNDLGAVYYEMGRYGDALSMHNEALAISRRRGGERHPDVAKSISNIGAIYDAQGDLKKALEYFIQALDIQMEAFGRESETVLKSLGNIGCVYIRLGEVDKGLEMLEEVQGIQLRISGGKDSDTLADSLSNTALIYAQKEEFEKALAKSGEALAIYRRLHGEKHIKVADTLLNLCKIHMDRHELKKATEIPISRSDLDELDDAIRLATKAMKIYRRVHGSNEHKSVVQSLASMAVCYLNQGKIEKMQETMEESIGIGTRIWGADHPEMAILHYDRGQCREGGWDKEGALESFREAQRINRMHGISSDCAKDAAERIRRLEGSL